MGHLDAKHMGEDWTRYCFFYNVLRLSPLLGSIFVTADFRECKDDKCTFRDGEGWI